MKSIDQIIDELPEATTAERQAAHNAQPPEARPGPVYVTYLSLGEMRDVLGEDAGNVAGAIAEGLAALADGPVDLSTIDPRLPNRGKLRRIHNRLDGYPGVDAASPEAPGLFALLASGIPQVFAPLLTAEQAAGLLRLGYHVVEPLTLEQVAHRESERATAAANLQLALRLVAKYNAARAAIDNATTPLAWADVLGAFDLAEPVEGGT